MKKLKVIFKEQALFDLEDIWLYTLNTWSLTQADRYHSLIIKEIEFWIKKEKSGNRASYAQGSLFDSGNSPITEEEEQIKMSIKINKEMDYT
jgi:plasmid stabilization system protein ParE